LPLTKKHFSGTGPLTPEQTKAWVQTYGRHSRIYAWGFFALILPVNLGVIWWEMGEINEDVLYSFGFAAVVTFFLDGDRRVCLACGSLYGLSSGTCPRCRAPEPDHDTLARLTGL
jgi:hypothetical protein